MSNDERVVATVTSSITSQEKLETRARRMLDQLTEHVNLPYGMVLEGRVSTDRFNNYSLYVFLRKDNQVFTGRSQVGNEGPRTEETKGGKWISLNKRDFDPAWEARDLRVALFDYLEEQA